MIRMCIRNCLLFRLNFNLWFHYTHGVYSTMKSSLKQLLKELFSLRLANDHPRKFMLDQLMLLSTCFNLLPYLYYYYVES